MVDVETELSRMTPRSRTLVENVNAGKFSGRSKRSFLELLGSVKWDELSFGGTERERERCRTLPVVGGKLNTVSKNELSNTLHAIDLSKLARVKLHSMQDLGKLIFNLLLISYGYCRLFKNWTQHSHLYTTSSFIRPIGIQWRLRQRI